MSQHDLQKLLLQTAVCTIACDGEIHEMEIAELHSMVSQAAYFKDFSGQEMLDEMLESVKRKSAEFFHEYLANLKLADLSPVQELLVLEVLLRIVYADERCDENEALFFQLVRSRMRLRDEMVVQRFGQITFMSDDSDSNYIDKNETVGLSKLLKKIGDIQLKVPEIEVAEKVITADMDGQEG